MNTGREKMAEHSVGSEADHAFVHEMLLQPTSGAAMALSSTSTNHAAIDCHGRQRYDEHHHCHHDHHHHDHHD